MTEVAPSADQNTLILDHIGMLAVNRYISPASLPAAAIERLAFEAAKAINAPAAMARVSEDTVQNVGGTSAEVGAVIAAERSAGSR